MPDGSSSMSIIQFSEDLNNAEAPAPLPKGTYPAEITSAEIKTSQTSGNRYLATLWRVSADAYPADFSDGDPEGTVLAYNRILVEDNKNARYRLRKFLEAIGGALSARFDPSDILGLTAQLEVGEQEYDGETRAAILRVMAA